MKTLKLIPALIVMSVLLFGCGKETPEPEPEPTILPEKIVFYHGDTTMAIGSVDFMLARVSPRNATDPSLEWSSSDASVVSVDESGGFKAEKEGTATITVKAKAGTASAQRKMTVESDIKRVRGFFTYESSDRIVLNLENRTNTIITPSDIEIYHESQLLTDGQYGLTKAPIPAQSTMFNIYEYRTEDSRIPGLNVRVFFRMNDRNYAMRVYKDSFQSEEVK